jgi:hypothetical protein
MFYHDCLLSGEWLALLLCNIETRMKSCISTSSFKGKAEFLLSS